MREAFCETIVIPGVSGITHHRNLWFRHAECTDQSCDFKHYRAGTKAVILLRWVFDEICDFLMNGAWIKSVIPSCKKQDFFRTKPVISFLGCHRKCKEKGKQNLWFRNSCAHSFLPNHTLPFKSDSQSWDIVLSNYSLIHLLCQYAGWELRPCAAFN